MRKAAAYARVSTKKQSETSIETQFEIVKNFARENSIEIIDEFHDKITASGTEKRPGFSTMVERALDGAYNFILVDKQDRFERDSVEEQVIIRQLEEKKVYVLYAREYVDPRTPAGRLQRWIKSGVNQFYIENLREEIETKTTKVAKRGYFLGGVPPFGFKLKEVRDPEATKNRKVYVIDDSEASLVREIFRQFANGKGYGEIVAWLNREGHLTRRGGSWSRATLVDMLRNEKYSGTFTFRKGSKHNYHKVRDDTIRVPGILPAIVDRETWERVQSRFTTAANKARSTEGFLMRGMVFCGDCGAKMYSNRSKPSPRYECGQWVKSRNVLYVGISTKKVDDFVIAYLRKLLNEDIDFQSLAAGFNAQAALNDHRYRLRKEELERKELELTQAIDRAVKAITEGSPLARQLEAKSRTMIRELEEVKHEISEMEKNVATYITAQELEERFRHQKEMLDKDYFSRRELVHELIERVTIFPGGYIEIAPKD